jgi:hypothetical protein
MEDNPAQLYVIFTGGDVDSRNVVTTACRVFGPYHVARFLSLPGEDGMTLWVEKRSNPPGHSKLATRRDGYWELHDGCPVADRTTEWALVTIRQWTLDEAREVDEGEWGSPLPWLEVK